MLFPGAVITSVCFPQTLIKRKSKILKVGVIQKKRKLDNEEQKQNISAWDRYMNEVKSYRDKHGEEEPKNRPLVK